MLSKLNAILQLLKDIYQLLSEIKTIYLRNKKEIDKPLLTKVDVIRLLNISDTTYRRYVRAGRLKPMKLHGIDMYQEDDLLQELEESRRKGRH